MSDYAIILAALAAFVAVAFVAHRCARWLRQRGYAGRLDALYNTVRSAQERVAYSVGVATRTTLTRQPRRRPRFFSHAPFPPNNQDGDTNHG